MDLDDRAGRRLEVLEPGRRRDRRTCCKTARATRTPTATAIPASGHSGTWPTAAGDKQRADPALAAWDRRRRPAPDRVGRRAGGPCGSEGLHANRRDAARSGSRTPRTKRHCRPRRATRLARLTAESDALKKTPAAADGIRQRRRRKAACPAARTPASTTCASTSAAATTGSAISSRATSRRSSRARTEADHHRAAAGWSWPTG